jgi:hypothetical protein
MSPTSSTQRQVMFWSGTTSSLTLTLTSPGTLLPARAAISSFLFARCRFVIPFRSVLRVLSGCHVKFNIFESREPNPSAPPLPASLSQDGKTHCAPFPSFFQLPVLMLMLITLLTDGALISVGYDIVKPNPMPEQWNLVRLFIMASSMGAVSLGACVLYMHLHRPRPPPVLSSSPALVFYCNCFLHQVSTHSTDAPHHSHTQARRCCSWLRGSTRTIRMAFSRGWGFPLLSMGKSSLLSSCRCLSPCSSRCFHAAHKRASSGL